MAFRFWLVLYVSWGAVSGQQAPIVQPGAPGHSGKNLTPATATPAPREPAEADTKFMQGMIMHHSQAVEMTALMPSRTHNKELLAFGKRISISQTDEMQFMKQWLTERGKPIEMDMGGGHDMMNMAGMDHSKMDHSKMMHAAP